MITDKIRKIYSNKTLFNGALFSMFSFFNRGISFLLLLILANYITPHEYGYLSLYSTVGMVLGYFIAMSTQGYAGIIFFKEGRMGISKTISAVMLISVVMLAVFFLILGAGYSVIPQILNLQFNILAIAIIVSFFNIFGSFWLDFFRLKENVKLCGIFTCGSTLLNFFLSIFLVKYLRLSWEGRVYAELFCAIILGSLGIGYFIKKGFFTRHFRDYLKPMLVWGIPLIPHMATTFIYSTPLF